MKQIYDFEQKTAPILNENMIRMEIERRKRNRQAALLIVGAALMLLMLLVFGGIVFYDYPQITALCIGYVMLSVMSGGVFAIVYCRNYDRKAQYTRKILQKGGFDYEYK